MTSLLPYMMQRAGQILVQRAMLKQAADAMRLEVSDADLARELRTGPFAEYLFPDGQYIGDDRYMDFVQTAFGTSRADFESQVKDDMELQRLQAMVTGGAAVSDAAVREAYRVQGMKVQFDYAAVSLEELKKTINPTDAELQNFFKQNAAKYAKAIPETRKIEYAAFDASKAPRRQGHGERRRGAGVLQRAPGAVQDRGAGEDAAHPDCGEGGRGREDGCGGQGQGRGRSEAVAGGREVCGAGEEVLG